MTPVEVLQRRLARAQNKVETLESLVENRSRELFVTNEGLQASNRFMSAILSSMAGGLIVVDASWRISLVNRRLLSLVDRPASAVEGQPLYTLLPHAGTYRPDDLDAAHEEDAVLETANGPIPILLTHGSIQDGQGHIYVVLDARERKASEIALEEAQTKLMDASRRAGKAEIATGVIHNVGNVITSVNVSLEQLRGAEEQSRLPLIGKLASLLASADDLTALFETPKGKQLPAFLTAVHEQLVAEAQQRQAAIDTTLEHLSHIALLISTQQQHAKTSLVLQDLKVTCVLSTCMKVHRARIDSLGVEIVQNVPQTVRLRSDRHQLAQILINLIANALDAMSPLDGPHKLNLDVGMIGENVEFSVRDNGPGVPEANLERIFEHGFTTRPDGHGFGLHMSANAAKQLGGTLRCEPLGSGQGAKFVLTVPRLGPLEETP